VRAVMEVSGPPSQLGDFQDAWEEAARKVEEEEGNIVYSLRRVGGRLV
jgi:quinol monooxygenase YgiN